MALALAVFSISIAFSTYKIWRDYELISAKFIPNLWVAAQAEIELLRFLNELHLFAHDETISDAEGPIKRLYILWSRLPILLGGSESTHVRAVDGAVQTIKNLDAALEELEPEILSLTRENVGSYQHVYRTLLSFEIPLHKIVASTMNKDEEVAAAQRDDIRHLYYWLLVCFVGMASSAILLVILLFREINKVKGLLTIAHAAESTASAARTQLGAVIDAVPARIAAHDRMGQVIFRNRFAAEGVEASVDAASGPTTHGGLDERVFSSGALIPLFEEEQVVGGETSLTWLTTKVPLKGADGEVAAVVTVSLDITEQKRTQRLNTLLATAVEHAGDVIEITDYHSRFQYVNAAFESMSGYRRDEAIGQTPFSLLMGEEANEPYYRAVQECIVEGRIWHGTLRGHRKDGTVYQQEASISPVRASGGAITHFVAVKRDITARVAAEAQIHHLAHHDVLTGLPNRLLFQDRLQRAVAQARRDRSLSALLLIDLDNFKDINDAFGHDIGDLLLSEVGRRLKNCTRDTDTVARLGGDEFAVILSSLADHRATTVAAQKLLERLAEPFALDGQEAHVSASIGITFCVRDSESAVELVKNADMAMYNAKQLGRNRYQFFREEMNREFQFRKSLERDLRRALVDGELELYYQPQVDALTETLVGAEALVRWRHPERGLISPAEFITIAEDCGLIVPLGEWVLRAACRQNRAWQRLGLPPIRMAVNLSAVQFLYRDLVDKVMSCLGECDMQADYLELEITEGILMRDTETATTLLRRLSEEGISIAVDDFGTGYSSMAYLKRFPVSKIKIDRAFVADLTKDRGDAAIVNAIIKLGHGLGLRVSAEGVETAEQMWHLRRQGCNELQGYYFGRPMPAEGLEQYLRNGKRDLTGSLAG